MVALLPALCWGAAASADAGEREIAAYVRARAADADGAKAEAAKAYAEALRASPYSAIAAARAFRVALDVGDAELAARSRAILERADVAPADAALLSVADAVATHDDAALARAIESISKGPFDFLAPTLRAWQLVPANGASALSKLDVTNGNPLATRVGSENRALIMIALGRSKDAIDLLKVLTGVDPANVDFRITAAQMLAQAGESDAAMALLQGNDTILSAYRPTLGKGLAATPAVGIARLFTRLGANLDTGKAARAAIVLATAALRLEPDNDRARLVLASALINDNAADQAIRVLGEIAPSSPANGEARAIRVAALQASNQAAAALAASAEVNALPTVSSADAQRYGDLLMAAGRYDDAAHAYGHAIDLAGSDADWVLYLQKGAALDQAGQWALAEPALAMAVERAPNSPVALNYLGYARLEHGGDPKAATKLLERANALQPDNYSIVDSLAWGYFSQGEVGRALPLLEKAAENEPANSTISEHLGDAYWASGRQFEARYAWRAATITASAGDNGRLSSKLAEGLPPRTARR